jgi:hypothetical protein
LTDRRRQELSTRLADLKKAVKKWREIETLCETINLEAIDYQIKHAGVGRRIDHTHAHTGRSRYSERTALEAPLFEASAQRVAQVYQKPTVDDAMWSDWLFDTALRPLLWSVAGRWLAVSRSEVFPPPPSPTVNATPAPPAVAPSGGSPEPTPLGSTLPGGGPSPTPGPTVAAPSPSTATPAPTRDKKGKAYLADGLSTALGNALPYFTELSPKVRGWLEEEKLGPWGQEDQWLKQESERTVREAVLLLVLTRLDQARARRMSPNFDTESTDGRLPMAVEGKLAERGLKLKDLRDSLLDELEGLHWSRREQLDGYAYQGGRADDQRRFALQSLDKVAAPRRRVVARARDPEALAAGGGLPVGAFGLTGELTDLARKLQGKDLASYNSYNQLLWGWFLARGDDGIGQVALPSGPRQQPNQEPGRSLLNPILRLMWLSGALGREVTQDLHEQQQRFFAFVIRPAMYLGGIPGSAGVLQEMPGLAVDFPSSNEEELSVGSPERLGAWCARHRRKQPGAADRFPEPAVWAAFGASVLRALPVGEGSPALPVDDDPLRLATPRTALYSPLFTYCIELARRSKDLLGSRAGRRLEDVALTTFFRFQRTTEEGGWDDAAAIPELYDRTVMGIDLYFLPHALHRFLTELWELLGLVPGVVKDLTDDRGEDTWTRPLDKAKFLDKLTLRFSPDARIARPEDEPAPDLGTLYQQLLRVLKFPLDFATTYLSVRGVGGSVSREDVLSFVELFSTEDRPKDAALHEWWVYQHGLVRLHNGFLQLLVPEAATEPLPDSLEELRGPTEGGARGRG